MSGQWKHAVWALVIAFGAVGCGDDDKPADKPGKPATPTGTTPTVTATPIPASDGPSFDEFDMPGIAKKLEGVWIVDGGKSGKHAWEIRGDQITISDGTTDSQATLVVQAPCRLGIKQGATTNFHSFVFEGDQLFVGSGNAGVRSGDVVVACIFGGPHVYRDGKCTHWQKRRRGWKSEEAECRPSPTGFGVTLKTGGQYSVSGEGPVMKDGSLPKAERADDLAAAKAKL